MENLAPDFEHDVFMSYAHGRQRGSDLAPLRDWSQKFIDLLRAEIYALHPDIGTIDVWDDRSVDPTAALTDEIKREVERSRVLLILMSPWYLESVWCREERDWFEAQFVGRRRSPGRVFVVRAVSTNTDKWPAFLKDSHGHPDIGFQFHPETTKEEVEHPFCWPDLMSRTDEFNKPFRTLRTTLVGRLKAIKGANRPTDATRPADSPQGILGRRLLYFHAASAAEDVRAEVESELREEGYGIVPAVPPAGGGSLAEWQAEPKKRVQAAQYCHALTLLRATDDPAFNIEFLEVGADELARINSSRSGRRLPCAILDRSSAPFDLADFARQSGIEIFDLNNPAWRPAFRNWLSGATA
jgi:hypothetical protein